MNLPERIFDLYRGRTSAYAVRKGNIYVPARNDDIDLPLTAAAIAKHLNGGPHIGVYLGDPNSSSVRFAVYDLDDHNGELGWDEIVNRARAIVDELKRRGFDAFVTRSGGGNGIHISLFWKDPQAASAVRVLMADVLKTCDLGDHADIEIFPKQDSVSKGGYGNLVALPFARKSVPLDDSFDPLPKEKAAECLEAIKYSPPVPEIIESEKEFVRQTKFNAEGALNGVSEGQRDTELHRLICSLQARGRTKAEAHILAEHAALNCDPPFDLEEVRKKVERVYDQFGESEDIIILPNDHMPHDKAAEKIFQRIALTHTMFIRDRVAVELHGAELEIIKPAEFQSRIDNYGQVKAYVVHKDQLVLRNKRCSKNIAEVLLASKEIHLLPRIALVANAPIIVEQNGAAKILGPGYHENNGGVLVTGGDIPPEVPVEEAVSAIRKLHIDFSFQTRADESRAIAAMITPALKMGGLLNEPTPVDVAEADESQSGKTHRQKLDREVYREKAYPVFQREKGVGSTEESLAKGMISGSGFIALDNFRGPLNSPMLEGIITMPECATARVPYSGEVTVDVRRVTFSLTSNGVETTRDFSNRSCIVRINKQPRDHKWHQWKEGSLLQHVKANQPYYLGCVFSVIRHWIEAGKPRTKENRHDMREWVQSLDWIIQNIFKSAPLMDGHLAAQERVANPALVWLRAICIGAERAGQLDKILSASAVLEISEEEGLTLPRARGLMDEAASLKFIGQTMARLFRKAEDNIIEIDGYFVERFVNEEYIEDRQEYRSVKRYQIRKDGGEM